MNFEEAPISLTEPVRLLLIEDNPIDAKIINAYLRAKENFEYALLHAERISEGLKMLKEEAIDVILLDLFLPDSNGMDTFHEVFEAAPRKPVIVLTGMKDETLAVSAVKSGAQDYLVKGTINPNALVRTIRYGIERMRLLVALERSQRQKLEASEARFVKIINENADGIVLIGRDGVVRFVNPAAVALFGIPADSFIGQPFGHPVEVGQTSELKIEHHSGEVRYAEMRVVESNWSDEPVCLASLRNVTDRKLFEVELIAAKEKAEEMARFKSAVLANISHEIRTPLTSILGFAAVLAEEVPEPKHRQFLRLIERSGRRLMSTLNSVLDLAKLETHGVRLSPTWINVVEKARDAVDIFRPMVAEKPINLRLKYEHDPIEACLDEVSLERIFYNLIGNAVKFTEKGSVTVHVGVEDSRVLIRVRDTGIGIEASFIPHLFKEFRQESTGWTRSHGGSGLGLTITKRLVDLMGGAIKVQSQKGAGSTFTVTLPIFNTVATSEAGQDAPAAMLQAISAPSKR